MSNLENLAELPLLEIWGDTVRARRVEGERITLAIVELAPNAVVPEHVHENEQLGICLEGSGSFTLDGETREIVPGTTWRILANRPHNLTVGPAGAVVIDVFTPIRSDWADRRIVDPAPAPAWPEGS